MASKPVYISKNISKHPNILQSLDIHRLTRKFLFQIRILNFNLNRVDLKKRLFEVIVGALIQIFPRLKL